MLPSIRKITSRKKRNYKVCKYCQKVEKLTALFTKYEITVKNIDFAESGLWEIGMTGQEIDGTYQALCLSKQDMSISNSQNDTINMVIVYR